MNGVTLEQLQAVLADQLLHAAVVSGHIQIEVAVEHWSSVAMVLRDQPEFDYAAFIDLSGVDYLQYGLTEWQTEHATQEGFDRAVDEHCQRRVLAWDKPRFAVVVQLLSITHGSRLQMKVFLPDPEWLRLPSLTKVWDGANWFEREAYDLFGIEFEGHPDMRRILTDYGFQGHPFRKDFPLVGEVEMRYDADEAKCVYEPVSIQHRVTVPKVFRHDHRYIPDANEGAMDD